MYSYRNIDEDINLLKFAKRYHNEESLTLDQLKYIAKLDGYSEKEIDMAIHDYNLIYVKTENAQTALMYISMFMCCCYIVYALIC